MRAIHATSISLDGRAVLIRGPSGSGKSDLALRLIEMGALLVSDDQSLLEAVPDGLMVHAPEAIQGLLEVRGLGIVEIPHLSGVPLALVVDLIPAEAVERLPHAEWVVLDGVRLPRLSLYAFHASAPVKVRLALASVGGDIIIRHD